jgi:uncharacterized membrane protein YeiB
VLTISWLAERRPGIWPVRVLARAGQMTLTLYLAHVIVFNEVVHQRHWVRATGLDTALLFAGGFWLVAVLAGAWWHRRVGIGPLERIYRRFGG